MMMVKLASEGIKRAESCENKSSNTGNAPIINLDNPDIWRSKKERGRLVNAQIQASKRKQEAILTHAESKRMCLRRLLHSSENSVNSPTETESPQSPVVKIELEASSPFTDTKPVTEERVETVLEDSLEHLEESQTVSNIKAKLLVFLNRMFEYKLFISPALFEAKLGYAVKDGLFMSPEYIKLTSHLATGKQYFDSAVQDKQIKFIDLVL
jgi:hypothetical protein